MSNKNKIQCLECGKWLEQITTTHLKKCCSLTIREYRGKYPNTILCSEIVKYKMKIKRALQIMTEETKQKIKMELI